MPGPIPIPMPHQPHQPHFAPAVPAAANLAETVDFTPVDSATPVNGELAKAKAWSALLLQLAERLGIPVALLLACWVGLWVAGKWAADNIATPLVSSHREFLQNQISVTAQQAKTLDGIQSLLQAQSQQLLRLETLLRREVDTPARTARGGGPSGGASSAAPANGPTPAAVPD